ncbi:LPXTG cell wall anchor domain-containing protein [Pseudarthrobacter sp. TAF60_1]|uniref:LPXTG cell wall anchor domain-containing protein n=1 Tax=Pseudarthrobacter sp. TAF60_1 TaxID=3233071 RepID=UPI003F9A7380
MKKALAALVLAGSIVLVGTAPAIADHQGDAYTGHGENEQGNVDNGDVQEGEQFNFSGDGFEPGEQVDVQVEQINGPQANGAGFANGASMGVATKITVQLAPQSFTATADAKGHFSIPLTISEAGTYRLTATGVRSGHTVTAIVTVKAAKVSAASTSVNGTGGLAETGADASLALWGLVGAGALAAGAASVVVVRRRAKADATA